MEKGVVQRTSLLISSTSRSGDNLAILLERPPEYHDPLVCLEFERESCLTRQDGVVLKVLARALFFDQKNAPPQTGLVAQSKPAWGTRRIGVASVWQKELETLNPTT